ncbi:phosphonopyruvate decarboxylase isoform X2 [Anabrus simplex]
MSFMRKCLIPLRKILLENPNLRNSRSSFSTVIDTPTQDKQVQEQNRRNEEVGHLTELVRDFLDPADFYNALRNIGINFFCGVPDSLLKDFCAYVASQETDDHHVIVANEGSAIGLAAGYHLATRKTCLVYLQNSGLGNTVNPLVSLAAHEVYSIPMLLLIGWRGEPGKRDEPQHLLQGHVTPGLLDSLGIQYAILPDYIEGANKTLQTAKKHMEKYNSPYALLVKRQTFLPYKLKLSPSKYTMTRELALRVIVDSLAEHDIVVSTTGMLSRELFEHRVAREQGHERDFLTVGSMGHASSIALGIAIQKPSRQVYCLDGDGSVIMHMGSMAIIGQVQPQNFKHVVLNNGAHDSVGGQRTAAFGKNFNFLDIAKGNGYKEGKMAVTEEELKSHVKWLKEVEGPAVLEIRIRQGSRKGLGRPTRTPIQNKADFMNFLAYGS